MFTNGAVTSTICNGTSQLPSGMFVPRATTIIIIITDNQNDNDEQQPQELCEPTTATAQQQGGGGGWFIIILLLSPSQAPRLCLAQFLHVLGIAASEQTSVSIRYTASPTTSGQQHEQT
jgi:hypothetical protein